MRGHDAAANRSFERVGISLDLEAGRFGDLQDIDTRQEKPARPHARKQDAGDEGGGRSSAAIGLDDTQGSGERDRHSGAFALNVAATLASVKAREASWGVSAPDAGRES
jgi:hypothetical protein